MNNNTANYDSSQLDSNYEIFLCVFVDMYNDFSTIDFSISPFMKFKELRLYQSKEVVRG